MGVEHLSKKQVVAASSPSSAAAATQLANWRAQRGQMTAEMTQSGSCW
jgi:hypothetical protein